MTTSESVTILDTSSVSSESVCALTIIVDRQKKNEGSTLWIIPANFAYSVNLSRLLILFWRFFHLINLWFPSELENFFLLRGEVNLFFSRLERVPSPKGYFGKTIL